jgi:hypothetical protein
MAEEQVNREALLYQIITDRRYISATDSNGATVDLMVRSLTPTEKTYADFLYNQSFQQAKKKGMLSKKQYMSDAIAKGLWTQEKERLITIYEAEIKQIEKDRSFYASSPNKGKQIKFKNDLTKATQKLKKLVDERDSYSIHSYEGYALRIQSSYILSRMILKIDGNSLWPSYEDYLNETTVVLIHSIIEATNKLQPLAESDIRIVARMPSWSIMWQTAKKGQCLFNRNTTEYSTEQTLLCYWAMMYDNVYESPDRPDDKIIEDDEALDKWFEDQRKERKNRAKQSKLKNNKMDKHGEIFVMVNTDEEADEVWEMNNEWTLARLQKEAQIIENSEGPVSEFKLRSGMIKRNLQVNNKEYSDKFASMNRKNAQKPQFLGLGRR